MSHLRIGIMAGETSGDSMGAGLIRAILMQAPQARFEGIGGAQMAAVGCHCLYSSERLAVMGVVEPLKRLPEILRIRSGILQRFLEDPPDVVIGIDSPDFMLGVEKKLKDRGIPVVHYVSPSVWAWRSGRIHTIKAAVNHILVILPFEAPIYQAAGVPVTFVGHPMADEIPLQPTNSLKQGIRKKWDIPMDKPLIALLAGSREAEWKTLIPVCIQAAQEILKVLPNANFVAPTVQTPATQAWKKAMAEVGGLPIHCVQGEARQALIASDVAVIKSGTATLEALLLKVPMTIIYKTSSLNYWIAQRVVRTPYIGLPNLLAGYKLVPELIQGAATPSEIAAQVLQQLQSPDCNATMHAVFHDIHQIMAKNANMRAAEVVLALARRKYAHE